MARAGRFEKLAAAGVRGLQPYVPGKPIEELERESGVKDSVKLASNENPLGPPAAAIGAVQAALGGVALYPDGSGYRLKQALAERFSVAPGQITLGNGSNDVLVLLAETFLSDAVEAVYDEHSFVVYRLAVQAAGAIARVAPSMRPGTRHALAHDLDAFADLLGERTRMVFIANPNNPTGTWIGRDALEAFLERVPRDVIVVLDEAYAEYVTEADYPDSISLLAHYPNLVVTRTFSKIYGLAGLRIGFSISHPEVAELLNRVRQPFNVNGLAQAAALAALGDTGFVAKSRDANQAGLAQLASGLEALGMQTTPSAGNFLLADCGGPALPYYEALLSRGIIVRPVGNYGLPNHLRISVGLPAQNARLLGELADICAGASGP